MDKSVILIKPDGLQRGLVGAIINRFERKGLKLVGIKMVSLNDPLLDNWYEHHKTKPFFADLKKFMQSTPVVAMVWEGLEAISAIRKLVGITKAREAEMGSIRGDFGMSQSFNLIHASDSAEAAEKETKLLFSEDEIFEYNKSEYLHIYASEERI